jgi:3-oxoacyl-[acyl-carrier protein] reductase
MEWTNCGIAGHHFGVRHRRLEGIWADSSFARNRQRSARLAIFQRRAHHGGIGFDTAFRYRIRSGITILRSQPKTRISHTARGCFRLGVRRRCLHFHELHRSAAFGCEIETPFRRGYPYSSACPYGSVWAADLAHYTPVLALAAIMSDLLDFTGKVVLVTGSSRGIGAEIIKAFGKRGAQCVVNYVTDAQGQNKADAANVARELNDPLVIECDVTQPDQIESMMMEIGDKRAGLDILVNNSGIISDRTIKKMSTEQFESVVRVNLTGTFTVTQKAAAILRNGGRIVNLSSVSGQMGLFGQANYSSSKAAIIALTKVSAREFARQNITVNAIAPGFIDIGMGKGVPEEAIQNFIKQIPLGRLGDVNEIVSAALFLASPMASYITGHVLNVNGGFYMG